MAVAGTISVRVAELEQLDLDTICAPGELEAVAGQVASVLAWGHALQARIAQRASELAGDRRGPGPIEIVQRGAGMSAREARTVARRAEVTAVLPSFGVALSGGRVSAEHGDTLGRAMLGLSEAKQTELASFQAALVSAAESSTPDEWNRRVRWLWGAFEHLRAFWLRPLPVAPGGWLAIDTAPLPMKHPSRVRGTTSCD